MTAAMALTISTLVVVSVLLFIALVVLIRGEGLLERIPTVRRFRTVRGSWGKLCLDLPKLGAVKRVWDEQAVRDGAKSADPTELSRFSEAMIEQTIMAANLKQWRDSERRRPISDVINVVSYPVERLSALTKELQLYAGLVVLVFIYHWASAMGAPAEATAGFATAATDTLHAVAKDPWSFVDTLEVAIVALFLLRLRSELLHLEYYTKERS